MSDYLQDLVQNIYTNCDMSGFNDYNKAVKKEIYYYVFIRTRI